MQLAARSGKSASDAGVACKSTIDPASSLALQSRRSAASCGPHTLQTLQLAVNVHDHCMQAAVLVACLHMGIGGGRGLLMGEVQHVNCKATLRTDLHEQVMVVQDEVLLESAPGPFMQMIMNQRAASYEFTLKPLCQ